MFGTPWGLINDDRIWIFRWTISLKMLCVYLQFSWTVCFWKIRMCSLKIECDRAICTVYIFLEMHVVFSISFCFHARVRMPLIWLNAEVRLKFIEFLFFDLFETFNISSKKNKSHLMGKQSLKHSEVHTHFCVLAFTPRQCKKCFRSVV